MNNDLVRLNFNLEKDFLEKMDLHILKNKSKYLNRKQFLELAIENMIEMDMKNSKDIDEEIKKLKSLLELNLQFTYSIMDRQDLKIVDLYYGGTLSAIKGREAIDYYYRNKKMNENKNHKTVTENNKEEAEEKEINPRWRITDL
ncbi:hypothetical protein HMPREF2767_03015 [Nosocomiicoccus sp. HMSC067E10]|uniref:hypothetical protein n=1 Tax=Nosocomiicoccus sp. HMSC067E10 TaxID=1739271 RepID=UPI0008A5B1E2|nr:hypothetical protein [Nosocomiicoccus sp. HMSC067E10]OFL47393.1 hypothetical protein HMPREF2767_03015 [Nosocomiicoccus sp. HMSC067E10]